MKLINKLAEWINKHPYKTMFFIQIPLSIIVSLLTIILVREVDIEIILIIIIILIYTIYSVTEIIKNFKSINEYKKKLKNFRF